MGFDLYGLNPDNPNNAMKPKQLDCSKKHTDKEETIYFNALDDYETEIVGSYFRANVWYWRPIWSFVCGACCNILTDKDMEGGSFNNGHKISKTKSKRIAAKLRKLDKSGIIQNWEDEMMIHYNKANKHNKKIQIALDVISKACKKEHGEDLAPANYPEPYKTNWNETYEKKDWGSSYPPSRDYIMEFTMFCDASGGFEIC